MPRVRSPGLLKAERALRREVRARMSRSIDEVRLGGRLIARKAPAIARKKQRRRRLSPAIVQVGASMAAARPDKRTYLD